MSHPTMSLYDLILLMHVFLEGHCITKSMQFVHMQDHITIEALYPRARKLQFELKIQLSYLESQTGSSGETLQTEARQNLTLLQQLLWQLESMIQVHTPEERPPWLQSDVAFIFFYYLVLTGVLQKTPPIETRDRVTRSDIRTTYFPSQSARRAT